MGKTLSVPVRTETSSSTFSEFKEKLDEITKDLSTVAGASTTEKVSEDEDVKKFEEALEGFRSDMLYNVRHDVLRIKIGLSLALDERYKSLLNREWLETLHKAFEELNASYPFWDEDTVEADDSQGSSSMSDVDVPKLEESKRLNMGSTTSSETNPCFTDDCFLRVPGHDEEREKFDKRLFEAREVKGDHNIKVFKEDIRTLETVMIMCLFKLSQYSLDYKLLVKDLKNEDKTMNEWLGLIRNTVFRNFNVMKQSKISFAIRKAEGVTVDGCYDTWSLSFKRLRPTVKTEKISGKRNTQTGSEEQRVLETYDFEEVLQESSEEIRTTFDLRLSIRRQMDEKIQERRRRKLDRIMIEEDFFEMNRTHPQERAEIEVVKSAEYSNGIPINQKTASVDNSQSSSRKVKNGNNVSIPQSFESDEPTSSNSHRPERGGVGFQQDEVEDTSSNATRITEPDFTDDCFLLVPDLSDEREHFYLKLIENKKVNNDRKIEQFSSSTQYAKYSNGKPENQETASEKKENSDTDDFEKLLMQKMQENSGLDEKIRELNAQIEQQKLKMEEDKKNADQKIEAEARQFEERRKRIEIKIKNGNNVDIPQSSESDQPTSSNTDRPGKISVGFQQDKMEDTDRPSTSQDSKIYKDIEDPKEYEPKSNVKIEEMAESFEITGGSSVSTVNKEEPEELDEKFKKNDREFREETSGNLNNIMGMGSMNSIDWTKPDFTDDCFFQVPGCDKEREVFYQLLYQEKKLNNQNKVIGYQEQTRTIETVMFFCLYKLSNRSFEYNVLTKQVENENVVSDEKLQQLYKHLLATIFCNFAIQKRLKISMEIRKTTDRMKNEIYDCYNLQYKKSRSFQENKATEEEKTPPTGNKNSYVYVTVKQKTIVPDNQVEETSNNSQEDQLEESNENATIGDNSPHETTDKSTTPYTNKKEESKDSEADDFEKLLLREIQEDNVEDEKIRELNEKIELQKVKMEEDKKNADQKIEAEEKEFEEKIKKTEKKFREAEKQKQKLNDEDMKKRRKDREEYERETEKIRQEHMKELHNFVAGFCKCIELKMKWEMKEDEWADWLKKLRSLIARARNQFLSFETSIQSYGVEDKESRCWVEEDLQKLRQEVLSTHVELYKAYFIIKDLSTQHTGHIFLFILQKQLSKICGLLLAVLKGIDETKIEEEKCLENLRILFSQFDSSDIYYTSELKKLDREQDSEKYKDIEDPKEYVPKTNVNIEEMTESSEPAESSPGNLWSCSADNGYCLVENGRKSENQGESKVDQSGVVVESFGSSTMSDAEVPELEESVGNSITMVGNKDPKELDEKLKRMEGEFRIDMEQKQAAQKEKINQSRREREEMEREISDFKLNEEMEKGLC
ncbi:hypothetical protein CRE_06066 [Caenorhabditis remanei]|uniref:Uncharacterized protein n=1 Tax=Caenorhabditis remanei TaxID=31234 RepID=E3NAZ7_CAERE|nr:hypothetical protein CRE_06066 [Caenorhabditis remanei]